MYSNDSVSLKQVRVMFDKFNKMNVKAGGNNRMVENKGSYDVIYYSSRLMETRNLIVFDFFCNKDEIIPFASFNCCTSDETKVGHMKISLTNLFQTIGYNLLFTEQEEDNG